MSEKTEEIKALEIGKTVNFTKTVGETDVYLFAGITGDFSPNHVNEKYMENTQYKKRIAQGVLLIGYMSTAVFLMGQKHREICPNVVRVSYGYDRIRFIKPVFIGDTITVNYTISNIDLEEAKIYADVRVINQKEELVAIATHITKVL